MAPDAPETAASATGTAAATVTTRLAAAPGAPAQIVFEPSNVDAREQPALSVTVTVAVCALVSA